MAIELKLEQDAYAAFLEQVRAANQAPGEFAVDHVNEGKRVHYYFQPRNFALVAYDVGLKRTTLVKYQHVSKLPSVDGGALKGALSRGGGSGNVMTADLSLVVCLVSEAARSIPIEQAMTRAIGGDRVELEPYRLLMNVYDHTLTARGGPWRPLERDDYASYFESSAFTGDRTASLDALRALG